MSLPLKMAPSGAIFCTAVRVNAPGIKPLKKPLRVGIVPVIRSGNLR